MDATKRDALKKLLDGYELKQNQQNQQREDRRSALEKFLADFMETVQSTITPSFEEFSAGLKARGHPCTIALEKPTGPHDSLTTAKITLTIFPGGTTLAHGNPFISYTASPNQRKVAVHRSTFTSSGGTIVGSIGEYTLGQLSRETVEQHLLDLAETIFSR